MKTTSPSDKAAEGLRSIDRDFNEQIANYGCVTLKSLNDYVIEACFRRIGLNLRQRTGAIWDSFESSKIDWNG